MYKPDGCSGFWPIERAHNEHSCSSGNCVCGAWSGLHAATMFMSAHIFGIFGKLHIVYINWIMNSGCIHGALHLLLKTIEDDHTGYLTTSICTVECERGLCCYLSDIVHSIVGRILERVQGIEWLCARWQGIPAAHQLLYKALQPGMLKRRICLWLCRQLQEVLIALPTVVSLKWGLHLSSVWPVAPTLYSFLTRCRALQGSGKGS